VKNWYQTFAFTFHLLRYAWGTKTERKETGAPKVGLCRLNQVDP
jgi:hypothetical protein